MLKGLPIISKKFLIVLISVMLVASMILFISPGKIHAAGIDQADFSITGSDPTNTSSITVTKVGGVTITAGTSTVVLPEGTVITRSGGENFNAINLAANVMATLSSLSGFGSGNDVYGAFEWGIPGIGLEFSQAITLNVLIGTTYGGTSIVGQTVYILRSITGTSGWTSAGIVAPATAVVDAGGFITFQATKASTYAATETGTVAAPSKPLTPEEQVLRNLLFGQQVDLYGKTTTGFVKMLYDNILGRVPDDEGLNNWVTALNDGKITLGSAVYNFVFSKELEPIISSASPIEFITFLYKNVFNREQDSEGCNGWLSAMKNGMSKEDVLLHFIEGDEFKNICTMFNLKP